MNEAFLQDGHGHMLRWYLIQTRPSAESIAKSNLERQGYEVYFPRLVRPMRRRSRWADTIVALFPRYLFLRLSEGLQSLGPVRSTQGVANAVRFGSAYAVVPDQVISDLVAREDPTSRLHRLNRGPLVPGARVKIAVGPFDGLDGVFSRIAGPDRVIVLLSFLGRDTAVCVPSGSVLPAVATR
jgi:transcriptional antiterminator RfaH